MLERWIAALLSVTALGIGSAAEAAISTYPASVFQTGGTGAGNLVGNTPATARLNRNQSIGLNYGASINSVAGARLFFTFTAVSPATTYLWVRLGNWNGSAFTNAIAAGQLAPDGSLTANVYAQVTGAGVATVFLNPFVASCQSIGGCNALLFGNSSHSSPGSFFRLSTLVSATPEPSAWAMMMLGFAAIAMRMKALRRRPSRSALAGLSCA